MTTFTALLKIFSTKCFCNLKVARLGKFVSSEIFKYTVYAITVLNGQKKVPRWLGGGGLGCGDGELSPGPNKRSQT